MATLELLPDPTSPSRARVFVRNLMSRWGIDEAVVQDAELLITEVVTNGVLHAQTSMNVEIAKEDDCLHFAVQDGSRAEVVLRTPSKGEVTGRGIFLLDRLSQEWQVTPTREGKVISFRLPIAAAMEPTSDE